MFFLYREITRVTTMYKNTKEAQTLGTSDFHNYQNSSSKSGEKLGPPLCCSAHSHLELVLTDAAI